MRYIWEIGIAVASITMVSVFLKVVGNFRSRHQKRNVNPEVQTQTGQTLAEKTA